MGSAGLVHSRSEAKPWNMTMDEVDMGETRKPAYEDEQPSQVTSTKFKTTRDRIGKRITVHKELFPVPEVWEDKKMYNNEG